MKLIILIFVFISTIIPTILADCDCKQNPFDELCTGSTNGIFIIRIKRKVIKGDKLVYYGGIMDIIKGSDYVKPFSWLQIHTEKKIGSCGALGLKMNTVYLLSGEFVKSDGNRFHISICDFYLEMNDLVKSKRKIHDREKYMDSKLFSRKTSFAMGQAQSDGQLQEMDICQLPPKSNGGGKYTCLAHIPSFSYNPNTKNCEWWIYGGCGGNENRWNADGTNGGYLCAEKCKAQGIEWMDGKITEADEDLDGETPRVKPHEKCKEWPKQTGPCRGYVPSYSYNPQTRNCEWFIFGGCGGTFNRWMADGKKGGLQCAKECKAQGIQWKDGKIMPLGNVDPTPVEVPLEKCQEKPGIAGSCKGYMPSYTYNPLTKICEWFVYGGCGGNENRWGTNMGGEDCAKECKARGIIDRYGNYRPYKLDSFAKSPSPRCQEDPQVSGDWCRKFIPSFTYNPKTQNCEWFIYPGCGGNRNRWKANGKKGAHKCAKECKAANIRWSDGSITPYVKHSLDSIVERPHFCFDPTEPGPCGASILSYAYNYKTGNCESFVYGGCNGNKNRWSGKGHKSAHDCARICKAESILWPDGTLTGPEEGMKANDELPPRCLQKMSTRGRCRAWWPSFTFDINKNVCYWFVYGGCGASGNRWDDIGGRGGYECARLCRANGITWQNGRYEVVNEPKNGNVGPAAAMLILKSKRDEKSRIK